MGRAQRAEPCAEQGLAYVDVAKAGDDLLVEQGGLDRRPLAGERSRQAGRGEARVERLGTEFGQQSMRVLEPCQNQIDRTESARIDEAHAPAVVRLQHQVLVRRGLVRARRTQDHPTGHAEMQQHRIATGQSHQDVFAAAAEPFDARAGQPLLQALRQRPAQVRAIGDGAHDQATLQPLLKASHHRLDFGEFRHWGAARYRWAA